MKNKFYITTAIDYVNGAPHVGHAYEKILADVLARWNRLNNVDTFFLTGTDENAQKNAQAAKEAGIKTEEFVKKNSAVFEKLCNLLNLTNDDFIKTTEKRHVKVAQSIFQTIFDKGEFFRDLIYIDDVISGIKKIMNKGKAGNLYWISSNKKTWFYQLGKWLGDLSGSQVKFVETPKYTKKVDVGNFVVDNSKLRDLGWSPKVSVKEGILKTLDYFKVQNL